MREDRGNEVGTVTMFDCLHDMGDPLGAARRVREAPAPDGTWLLVEPFASDRVEENFTPVGRLFYSASTFLCVPNALSRGGDALGAQAGEAAIREPATEAGFTRFRRSARPRSPSPTRSGPEDPFGTVRAARTVLMCGHVIACPDTRR
ncbi:hypothetical protein [Thermostaphylospora chromogena]|jgi:hypothetical protein|uniref:hypothetical protein n=1 Tax=Thermostaphylospora chromogena TaxID=35622 RepID=UPI001A968716|nr:hypothetical protein [Thermostaphylospora chromogena]